MTKETRPEVKAIQTAYDADHVATVVQLAEPWLKREPTNLSVTCWYVESLFRMTHYDKAASVLDSALKSFENPGAQHFLYLIYGQLERYRGQYLESEKWYEEAIRTRPNEATAYIFLGAALAKQGKLVDAERVLRDAIQCHDGAIDEAYCNLGLVLRGQGKFNESVDALQSALALDPDYEDANNALKDVEKCV